MAKRKKKTASQKPAMKINKNALKIGGKTFLHVGVGSFNDKIPNKFKGWKEIKLNVDPATNPDICTSLTNLGDIEDGTFDAVWCPFSLRQVYSDQVNHVFQDLLRILKVDGFLYSQMYDLQKVAEFVEEKGLNTPLFKAPAGPICGLDIFYGFRRAHAAGAHDANLPRTGFDMALFGSMAREAGFRDIRLQHEGYTFWGLCHKRAEHTEENWRIKMYTKSVNDMMQERDEMDKEPEQWSNVDLPIAP
jgi:SAM-dependent methyltransferase